MLPQQLRQCQQTIYKIRFYHGKALLLHLDQLCIKLLFHQSKLIAGKQKLKSKCLPSDYRAKHGTGCFKGTSTAPFKLTEITGNFPIYSSHSFSSCAISNPEKRELSLPYSKKYFSILIFRDLPNLLGRVKRFTTGYPAKEMKNSSVAPGKRIL